MHHAWLAHLFMLRPQHLSTLDTDSMDTMDNTDTGTTDMSIKAGTGNKQEYRANRVSRQREPLYLSTRRSMD
jgi:hypothetical protein